MYLPPHFIEPRLEALHRIIRENPLGTLVTHSARGLDANHIPFLLDSARGAKGTLLAHVARANPLWTDFAEGADVMVVFRGPHGYISPNWYPSKHEAHRQVPTWNYEVVHAHGRLRIVDDEKFLRGLLARLTRHHEASEPSPWKMGDAPADYIDQMLKAIVGVEVDIVRLEGKRKLSQNRDTRDFEGVVSSLHERGNEELSAAMASTKTDRGHA
jgi:transcriptional regulator